MQKRFIALAGVIMLVTLGLVWAVMKLPLGPLEASAEARLIDTAFRVVLGVMAWIFAIVVVFLVYSLVAFRRRGEPEEGPHYAHHTPLEVAWTVIPTAIVIGLAAYSSAALYHLTSQKPDELVVEVTAFQFGWRFEYPAYGITSSTLMLPKGRPVVFKLRSLDVIHSFYVPEFRIKQDAVPGMTTEVRVTPIEPGEYRLICAELCGAGHAYMTAVVKVVEPGTFEGWVQAQRAGAATLIERGRELARQFGCLSCHSTDGTKLVGPSWQGLFGREEVLADGTTITVDEAYLKESILDPNAKIVQGFSPNVMPPYRDRLSDKELKAIIAFIKSLAEGK